MNKCTLSTGIPAKTSLQNALSEGNHNGHGHGTAQDEGANIKTSIKSASCSFSTVPQSFIWHKRQTTSQPTKSCDRSLYIWFSTHLWPSLLLQLIQILIRWAATFSQNLSSPVHKEKQSSLLLSELLLLCFRSRKQHMSHYQ